MIYNVFRNNIKVASVKPLPSSELVQKSEESDYIDLNFESDIIINLEVGDYIYYTQTNLIYTLNYLPNITNNAGKYEYNCRFQGNIHNLEKVKCFLDTPKTVSGYYRDYNFELTGTVKTFLKFIVDNLNRDYSGYIAGDYIESTEQTISFNNFSVYDAIIAIQEKFSFRWRLEGKTLHFAEKTGDYAYLFQVGRLRGFKSLERIRNDEVSIVTAVYGYGNTTNLPSDYEGDGLYDKRLSFDGVDGFSKLESNVSKYGTRQSIQEFDIQPEFTGEVSSVDNENLRVFYASNVPFDINNYLIDNVIPTIKFVSGNLSGTEFNVSYNSDTSAFTVDFVTEGDITYPNETIKIQVGDEFKILNIGYPDEYITEAKNKLQQATQDYIDKYSKPLQYFEGEVDEQYIQKNNIKLKLYDIVRVVSPTFNLDSLYPIQELTQNISNPNQYNIKFGDILPKNLITKLNIANFNTSNSITNVSNTVDNSVTIIGDENQWL